jgi:membrane protein YqaA with SNARE-associated domain
VVVQWFADYGFWVVFIAGFSPVPYKIFTIAAGGAAMMLPQFVIASLISRGARFFLVAALMRWGGPRFEPLLRRYIDIIGWILLIAAIVAWLVLRR